MPVIVPFIVCILPLVDDLFPDVVVMFPVVVETDPAARFPSDVIVAPCILLSEVICPLLSIPNFTAHVSRPT